MKRKQDNIDAITNDILKHVTSEQTNTKGPLRKHK